MFCFLMNNKPEYQQVDKKIEHAKSLSFKYKKTQLSYWRFVEQVH